MIRNSVSGLAGVGFDLDQVRVHACRGSTVERTDCTFEKTPLRSPMEKHRKVLTLHTFQHQQSGFAIRENCEVFVHGGPVCCLS